MKCRYQYCKQNHEVEKEEAIRDGKSYYHKECYQEMMIKRDICDLYLTTFGKQTKEGTGMVNKCVKQIVHDKGFEAEYLYFVLEKIIERKKKIYNVFGLHLYINDGNIKRAYDNKYKNLYGDFVLLSENEYQELVNDLGEKSLLSYIDRINKYIKQTQKQYNDYFTTIKAWYKKDQEKRTENQHEGITIHSS